MATETIFGCVTSEGQIIFEQALCEYPACLEFTGTHAGQVAVTIGGPFCDDTFYGCVDFATGKFEVVVPDDCCNSSETICSRCSPGITPKIVRVDISGTTSCDGVCQSSGGKSVKITNGIPNINGTYNLTQVSDCVWSNVNTTPIEITYDTWSFNTFCSGSPTISDCTQEYDDIAIFFDATSTQLNITARSRSSNPGVFLMYFADSISRPAGVCAEGSFSNIRPCDFFLGTPICLGGLFGVRLGGRTGGTALVSF